MIERHQTSENKKHSGNQGESVGRENLSDEREIRFVIDDIDNCCDAKDWKRCRAYFTNEISVDFKSLDGSEPAEIAADRLIKAWQTNLYAEKKSFHQRTNHRIEIKGANATVYSKAHAYNLLESGELQGMWEVWGFYGHTLERTESGWKVSGMSLTVAHQRGDERIRRYLPE